MNTNRYGYCFCLANFLDMYVFVIGGDYHSQTLKIVSRYNIANDRWERMPELNEG